jgi:hypothetical protein
MFSLQSLDIAQTEIVRKTIHSSHQYDREMQKALERVRDERNNLEDVLRETNEELKTEHIAKMAGVTTANELNAVLQQVEAELSHAKEENRRARTETAQENARLEANYMEQLISALNLIQIKEAPPNRVDAYAWHLCPVSGEVMTDPVIINAPYCACTCDRSSFQKWTDFGGRNCPVCGVALGSNRIQPNSGLRDAIQSRLQSLSQSETNMPHDTPAMTTEVTTMATTTAMAMTAVLAIVLLLRIQATITTITTMTTMTTMTVLVTGFSSLTMFRPILLLGYY